MVELVLGGLKEKTINFLRRYGHLEDPERNPDFRDEDFPGFMDNLAAAYPWYRGDPWHYQPAQSGDEIFRANYERMQMGLEEVKDHDFAKKTLRVIPDSGEYVVVDIGSHLGRYTRPLARAKPSIRVYMVDRLKREEVEDDNNYRACPRNDIAGEELRVRLPFRGSMEQWINELLQASGYRNITYIHKDLALLDPQHTNLGMIGDALRTRRVAFTGYRNPRGLGNITASEAIYHSAERVLFNNTALEKMPPESPQWSLMRDFLKDSLSPWEIEKVISLVWDPEYKTRKACGAKYDYNRDPGQRMFGTALKQLFVLAQVDLLQRKGMEAGLYLNMFRPEWYSHYNDKDHHIEAVSVFG